MNDKPYLRIATEEAWATQELLDGYIKVLKENRCDDPGFKSLWGFYLYNQERRAVSVIERLPDLGEMRLKAMDDNGIAKQILLLTSPGVQVFDADTANGIAASSNDQLGEAIRKHPTRYSGLAAFAPQDPTTAAKELERGVRKLGLKGGVVNSHTMGEYLDDRKFWPILEAAEALDVPIYIHPQTPPAGMIKPYLESGLEGAVWGFAAETGLHLLRIIVSGAFDRFPKLKIVVGHLGEGLPFWLYRIDFMHAGMIRANRYPMVKKLNRKPSDYLKENIWITNSGVAWQPAIRFCQDVLGMDRVMYAMDYPYQFVPEEVTISDNLAISDADKKKYFQTNAETVFRL